MKFRSAWIDESIPSCIPDLLAAENIPSIVKWRAIDGLEVIAEGTAENIEAARVAASMICGEGESIALTFQFVSPEEEGR